ncbi:sulfatase/phosphatase domain-containing protein [Paenibacillus popilliae]|uniref:Arylsulfatase A n=1 Tax=Paenibacillus popilliae ATCC 14706 TaxID=1212764 RepID=M9M0C5_PAEPP|nr:sulfatase/phosphatase domain-containing protein [Paenibacillus popilliae]GAC42169.1 arylsulfatase A [Paenibacillus popilliae ATCC 14706]
MTPHIDGRQQTFPKLLQSTDTRRLLLANGSCRIEGYVTDVIDKGFMYEESLRMPFVVRYPRAIAPGGVTDTVALKR